MTSTVAARGAPIEGTRQLVEWFEAGSKPPADWRIGTEHEKFAFTWSDLRPLPYAGEKSIRALLERMTAFGWVPVLSEGLPIGLERDGASISLEPGGQFELSGVPLLSLHETCDEVNRHLVEVNEICEQLGCGMLGLGFIPKWTRDEIPVMPKPRYRIMRDYMPKKGRYGLDMMLRTCTVQVNLDFADEADMVQKFRTSLALQPIATALFAASPFTEGRPNGYHSYRSQIWTDTDNERSGVPAFVFEPGMGFERYVDYALDVPMYFVYRDGRYIDASGQSFRDFIAGRLPACPGEVATIGDFVDHLTTLFPEVRLKRFLEMRGADGGPWRRLCALPAFWVGLLYDQTALDEASHLVRDWTHSEILELRNAVPRQGFATRFRSRTVHDIVRDVLTIARGGLRRRARLDRAGNDETGFLDTLQRIAESGRPLAVELLEAYDSRWHGSVDPAYVEYAY